MSRRAVDREPSPRLEAIKALEHAIERLVGSEPIGPLDRKLLCATIEHARDQVTRIQELKRPRRTTSEVAP